MPSWNDIDIDFGGNETVNFGPRIESGTALYQLETHATISAPGGAAEFPSVLACATSKAVFVSTDRQLSVFSDNCRKYSATLEFASVVCALDASDDGKFLAVGEQSGAIHIVNGLDCSRLFSSNFEEPSGDARATFLDILLKYEMSGKSHLLVLTGSGRIHLFRMDLGILCNPEILKGSDGSFLSQLSHTVIDTSQAHGGCVESMMFLPLSCNIITCGSGEFGDLCLWKKEDERYLPHCSAVHIFKDPIVKCDSSRCETRLYTLDQSSRLNIWSVDQFVLIWASHEMSRVEDFSVLNEIEDQTVSLVTLAREPSGAIQMRISAVPTMECLYSVELNPRVALARSSSSSEELYWIEGEDDPENPSCVSKLRVRGLTEALPESRLQRMLYKKQFVEAEEFSKQYDLDIQSVYEAKARFFLDVLSQHSVSEEKSYDVLTGNLKTCLNSITDDEYVVECCLSAALPSLELMLELLECMKMRIRSKKVSNPDINKLMKKLAITSRRLGTFQMMYGGSHYGGNRWRTFQSADLLTKLQEYLRKGWMHAVWVIWSRHLGDFQVHLNRNFMSDLLNQIPDETFSDELIAWLSQGVIPFAVRNLPQLLPVIAAWMEERAKNLEVLQLERWPRNALEFCELLSSTFKTLSLSLNMEGSFTPQVYATQVCNLSIAHAKMKADNLLSEPGPFGRLQKLRDDLFALCELREKYNCRLTLAGFQGETVESITYRMLDKVVAVELIPNAIRNTLRPYLQQHNLNEDQILFQYVGDLSQRYRSVVSCVGSTLWEVRAIEVMRHIKDPDFRCRALLNMMDSAYIPWSTDLDLLVEETLMIEGCPRKTEIEQKCRMVALKKLQVAYGLRNLSVAERDSDEMLAFYILAQDQPSAVQDALQVVSFYANLDKMRVYLFRAKFLVERGREEEMFELLKSLTREEVIELSKRFVRYVHFVLSASFQKSLKILYSKAARRVLRLYLELNSTEDKLQEQYDKVLSVIENISDLQVEFDEFLSVEKYSSVDFRKEVFARHFCRGHVKNEAEIKESECQKRVSDEKNVSQDERKRGKSVSSKNRSLYRLAKLLNISREEVSLEMATKALSENRLSDVMIICTELVEISAESGAGFVLMKVVHSLCAYFKRAPDWNETSIKIASRVHDLAQLSLTLASSDLLVDCLQMCRLTQLVFAAWNQCERGDYMNSVNQVNTVGRVQDLSCTDDLFIENGLVLDSAKILPPLFAVAFDCLPHVSRSNTKFLHNRIHCTLRPTLATLASLFSALSEVVGYSRDSMQFELACRVAMESVTMTLEHVASHPTCLIKSDQSETASLLLQNLGRLVNGVHEMVQGTLQKIFLSRNPDLDLAFAFACSLPREVTFDCLSKLVKGAGLQYKRIGFIAEVGLAFSKFVAVVKAQKTCQETADSARWGYNLAKMKISFSQAFQGGKTEKMRLLPVLVQNNLITVKDLTNYCAAFELNKDLAFLNCIKCLMIPSDPEFCVNRAFTALPMDAAIARARILCHHVEKVDDLVQLLGNILTELEPCYYEQIEFVLKLLNVLNPLPETSRNIQVLDFLKQYVHTAPSGGRLPFHPLISGNHWNVINPELNSETVDTWLWIGDILELQRDTILATAIRNSLEKYLKEKQTTEVSREPSVSWKENSLNVRLFASLSRLLTNISDFELAVATAVWIIKTLPIGADKVLALKCCVNLSQMWYNKCPETSPDRDKALKTLTQHSALYRKLQTEQILHNNDFKDPELFALSGLPAKLIFKLYEHESITKGRDLLKLDAVTPDIHSMVNKIAVASRVDVEKIRKMLLKQWLPSLAKQMQESADVTMMADELHGSKDNDEDELNLMRVVYLLQNQPIHYLVSSLFNFAYCDNTTNVTYMCRVRALRCLFALVDVESTEHLMMKTHSQICQDMKIFLYLAGLDRLRMPHTPESFEKVSKESLVRTIWRNHNHDVVAISVASDFCLDFGIKDEQLWNCMIHQLFSFRSFDQLIRLLDRMSNMTDVWCLPFVEEAIRNLASQVVGNASPPLAEEKLSECRRLCSIICRCPAAMTVVVLEKLIEEFKQLDLDACVVGWVLLLPSGERKQNALNELLGHGSSTILEQLKLWTEAGNAFLLGGLVTDFINGKIVPLDVTICPWEESRIRNGQINELEDDLTSTVFE